MSEPTIAEIATIAEVARMVANQIFQTDYDPLYDDALTIIAHAIERATGEAVQNILCIRCTAHRNVPQLNQNEITGAKCPICEIDQLREQNAALEKDKVQAMADHEGLLQFRDLLGVKEGENLYDAIAAFMSERSGLKLRQRIEYLETALAKIQALLEVLYSLEIPAIPPTIEEAARSQFKPKETP